MQQRFPGPVVTADAVVKFTLESKFVIIQTHDVVINLATAF